MTCWRLPIPFPLPVFARDPFLSDHSRGSLGFLPWVLGFSWVLQGFPSSLPRVLQGFCGFSSIGFGLPCFCKYYKVLQSITPYYYTVILRPRKSTILWLYYSFTLLFFASTILLLYYSFAPLYFDSTLLWLYYSLLYDSFTLRYRSYIGSFSTKLPLMNTHWHLYIFTMYTTKKVIMKNYPQQKSKKCGCVIFVVKDLQFS